MENNPYAAPQASLVTRREDAAPFYVVSGRKYWVMLLGTMGLYEIYWFYRNWLLHQEHAGSDIWPVARAIFSIFFAHSLNRLIDQQIERQRLVFAWSYELYASVYVATYIAQYVLTAMSFAEVGASVGTSITDVLGLALLPITGWALWRVQQAINVACGDPEGEANRAFTAANFAWLAFGTLLWILTISGMIFADID
jgi:hypothetical protein